MGRELSIWEVKEIIEKIANKEISLSDAAKSAGVTRPLLTRRIQRCFEDKAIPLELEERYKLVMVSNQTGKSLEEARNFVKRELTQEELESAKLAILSGEKSLSRDCERLWKVKRLFNGKNHENNV